jgi:hypothetical protein
MNAFGTSGWFSSLNSGVKWSVAAVITAGTLASAIGAIAALWPDPPSPIDELRAEISSATVDSPVTLEEYKVSREAESEAGEKSSAPASLRPAPSAFLAAVTLPRSPVDTAPAVAPTRVLPTATEPTTTEPTTTAPATTAPPTPPLTTLPSSTTTPPPPTTGPPITTTPATTGPEDDGEGIVVKVRLDEQARARMHDGVRRALRSPRVDQTDIGEACSTDLTDPDCGLSSLGVSLRLVGADGTSAPEPGPVLAEQLTNILTGIRTESLPSGKAQPVGVTVNYKITLTGFRGRIAVVRWALHSRAGKVPLPWLGSQVAARLKGEAETDTATPQVWVPLLPKDEGPFFVRLEVFNELGDRLDFRDTPDFR